MRLKELRQHLRTIDKYSDSDWVKQLSSRKKEEIELHDQKKDRDRRKNLKKSDKSIYKRYFGSIKFYEQTNISKNYVNDWIEKHAPGKVFLDYACGNGKHAIKAAESGASLAIGIDITAKAIHNAKIDAQDKHVENNILFLVGDAENTEIPDNTIDLVICDGVLHHMKIANAFQELHRILKPGGRLMAYESLNYNPIISLYRKLTPLQRTHWESEHILSLKDVKYAEQFFTVNEIKYWHFTSILGTFVKPLVPIFNMLDNIISKIPLLQLMAWVFTFELKNKNNKV